MNIGYHSSLIPFLSSTATFVIGKPRYAGATAGYGVHMATHMAIGWVCLGGGRYTFDQAQWMGRRSPGAFVKWGVTPQVSHL